MTALLQIENLHVSFRSPRGLVRSVRGISYDLAEGETLGIVGESGSGKSAHALAMLGLGSGDLWGRCGLGRLLAPARRSNREVSGRVIFAGRNLLDLPETELRDLRGREIGFVFQDPMSSLNPVLSIGRQITEQLRRHLRLSPRAAWARAAELLDLVSISDPHARLRQFPHELSGGMRQRVVIAMAISCEPKLLIADEPTTALDVTVQAQILDLIRQLQKRLGMALIWISHDLGVIAGLADRVQVMYAGRIVERGPVEAIFRDPRNAYTFGLVRSLPGSDAAGGQGNRLFQIGGQPPDPSNLPPGDPFASRNPFATARCRSEEPVLRPVADSVAGHEVAAWYDLRAALNANGGCWPTQADGPATAEAAE